MAYFDPKKKEIVLEEQDKDNFKECDLYFKRGKQPKPLICQMINNTF